MTTFQVSASVGDSDSITVNYDCGDDLEGLQKALGKNGQDADKVIYSRARSSIKQSVQGIIRDGIEAKKTKADIQKSVNEYVPGVQRRARTPAEKMSDDFDGMSAQEQKDLMARLSAKNG
jgi:hypothetical protein